jgi:branched-chain amino acid transport system substrate-binding protein
MREPWLVSSGVVLERSLARVAVVVATAALVGLADAHASTEPIRFGGSLSLTGSYAPFGQTQHRGIQHCVMHTNARGGLLGHQVELIVEDDHSRASTAVEIYRRLIIEKGIDAIIGPYSSTITEAVAELAEQHRMPFLASGAASSSIFRKGRRFVFMVMTPTDLYLEGLIDLAVQKGLKTIALIHQDTIFPRSVVTGGRQLAEQMGLEIVAVEAYPKGLSDFSKVLSKVRAVDPDVLAAATYFDDAVAITRALKEMDLNPRMFGATVGVHLPKYAETLGDSAEFVYGATQWEPQIVEMRAGGLIPIARNYPGAREFVESYRKAFPGVHFSHLTASAYAGCQILVEAIKEANSLDGERIRESISTMNTNTVYGAFNVDQSGLQVGHKMMWFQWQGGKKVIVWPREITPREPWFPMPRWDRR